jgi:hypothetical protein
MLLMTWVTEREFLLWMLIPWHLSRLLISCACSSCLAMRYKSLIPSSIHIDSTLAKTTASTDQSSPRPGPCAHKFWESRPPKCYCPWVHLLGWRTAITFLGSVADGTTTHYVFFFFPAHGGSLVIDTTSLLYCIERDDYTDRHYVD